MALFDMFKGSAPLELTPRNCLLISLLYSMASDGQIDPEEVGHLISVLGKDANRATLDRAVQYIRKTPPDAFLQQAIPGLKEEQRLCILLNMIDSVMADGTVEAGERALIAQFQTAFGFDDAKLEPHFRTLVSKNDRNILDR